MSEPIVIGMPTNTQLIKDLQPLKDILGLDGREGRFVTAGFRNVIFRTLRAQDIANQLYDFSAKTDGGIVGLDTMIETSLAAKKALQRKYEFANEEWLTTEVKESIVNSPGNRVEQLFQMKLGTITRMTVLARQEDEYCFGDPRALGNMPAVCFVTSYPNLTEKAVRKPIVEFFRPIGIYCSDNVKCVNGQVESIVRNQDYKDIRAIGVDIVRSGKSAKEYGLKQFGSPLLESKLGFYSKKGSGNGNLFVDFAQYLKESLQTAQIPIEKGTGVLFEDALQAWTPKP